MPGCCASGTWNASRSAPSAAADAAAATGRSSPSSGKAGGWRRRRKPSSANWPGGWRSFSGAEKCSVRVPCFGASGGSAASPTSKRWPPPRRSGSFIIRGGALCSCMRSTPSTRGGSGGARGRGGVWFGKKRQGVGRGGRGGLPRPGAAARRRDALAEARSATEGLTHPAAQAIGEMVAGEDAAGWDERVLPSLAALARLIEAGETRSSRIFSTEALGHSKALSQVRPRLERLVGPLDRLRFRDTGVHLLVGGKGRLRFPGGDLEVERFRSLGLAEEDVLRLKGVRLPAGGLLVVENLTSFHACLGPERNDRDLLVIWSAGYPG